MTNIGRKSLFLLNFYKIARAMMMNLSALMNTHI